MASRFFRPDWVTYREGFRKRTEHRWPAEGGPVFGGPSEPGLTATQTTPGELVLPRATINFYGEDRLRAIFGDPDMKVYAAEDLL